MVSLGEMKDKKSKDKKSRILEDEIQVSCGDTMNI